MNEPTPHMSEPPCLPSPPNPPDRLAAFGQEYKPFEGDPTVAASIDALLKRPARLVYELTQGQRGRSLRSLLLVTLAALAISGFLKE